MKTLHYILFVAVAAVLFSSCSSLSISRKRYSRGLNIDWTSAGDEKKKETVITVKSKPVDNTTVKTDDEIETADAIAISEEPATGDISEVVIDDKVSEVSGPVKTQADRPVTTSKRAAKKLKGLAKQEARASIAPASNMAIAKHLAKKISPSSTANDSDVALILLIILALIPPLTLLAVYLYYGEINVHFWLNLLFLLLAGGVFLGGASIGLGLPIIHALLVVLGVFG